MSVIYAYVTFDGRPIAQFDTEEHAKQFIAVQRARGQVDGQYSVDLLEKIELQDKR